VTTEEIYNKPDKSKCVHCSINGECMSRVYDERRGLSNCPMGFTICCINCTKRLTCSVKGCIHCKNRMCETGMRLGAVNGESK
jgi:hypothetical protein